MSKAAVDLVRSAFAAWNRGDIDAFAGHAAENVVWIEVSGRPEGGPEERLGRERMRRSLGSLFEAFESYRLELEELHDLGDRVVAIVREVAKGRASGVEIDGCWGYVITVEDGEMARIVAYREHTDALEAAGIGESAHGT